MNFIGCINNKQVNRQSVHAWYIQGARMRSPFLKFQANSSPWFMSFSSSHSLTLVPIKLGMIGDHRSRVQMKNFFNVPAIVGSCPKC